MGSTVAVIAKIPAAPGKGDEVAAVFQQLVSAVESEEGTLTYVMHRVPDEPDTIIFYEQYTDDAALAAHSGSDAMKAAFPKLAGLLAGRPEITKLTPIAGKGGV